MAWWTADVMYGSQLGLSQAASCGQDSRGPDAPVYCAAPSCRMCALPVYTNGLVSEATRCAFLALHLYLQDFSRQRNHRWPLRGLLARKRIPPPVPVISCQAIHGDPLHPDAEGSFQLI
jgi:hypothetical protein